MNNKLRRKIQRIQERIPNHPNIGRGDFDRYHDWLICYVIFDSTNRIKENWIRQIKRRCPNILEYINNRYDDSQSMNETCYRMLYNIESRPKCKVCGKDIKYVGAGKYLTYCSRKCMLKSDIVKEKRIKNSLERYGTPNPQASEYVKEKAKNTCLERYGTTSFLTSNKCKEIRKEKYGVEYPFQDKDILDKCKKTSIERYGVDNYLKTEECVERRKQTCLDRYGVVSWSQTEEFKEFMHAHKNEINEKRQATKKKNGTLTSSYEEQQIYQLILERYPDCVFQYKSKDYPFLCDYYIPSYNLYIEYQGYPSHGERPYQGTDQDLKILKSWKEKKYKGWVFDWTKRDVNKRKIAIKNKLRWIEFFYYDEDIMVKTIDNYIQTKQEGILSIYKKD